MSKTIGIMMCCCLISCTTENKTDQIHSQDDSAYQKSILLFKDSVEAGLDRFSCVVKNDPSGSTEGGEIKYYIDRGDTAKIEATYYGETGKKVYSLYVKDGALVYFDEMTIEYKEPISAERKVAIVARTRKSYVLQNLRVKFYWLDGIESKKESYDEEKKISKLYSEFVGITTHR
jgi:hypothetical protein